MTDTPDAFDLAKIRACPRLAAVWFQDEADSTNDIALREAPHAPCPLLVLTGEQRAGRGRGTNRWWARRGALTCSWVMDPSAWSLSRESWPRMALVAGLAALKAVRQMLHEAPLPIGLKWPNDVLIGDRKLAGILVESTTAPSPERLVIGIGMNVNNSLHYAPSDVARRATSLRDVTGQTFSLTDLLLRLVDELHTGVENFAADAQAVWSEWRQWCTLTGRHVQIAMGNRVVEGTCRGIGDDGGLRVVTSDGIETCYSGVVRYAAGLSEST